MTQNHVSILLSLVVAYLIGSIPAAIWWVKLIYKQEIRSLGSGNPGMTNVWRVFGWKSALPVALVDTLKGVFACWFASLFIKSDSIALWTAIAGLMAILGHSYTCFAKFKGGKGVLTSLGVFIFIVPISAFSAFGAWILVMALSRIVSLSSLVAAFVLPFLVYWETNGVWSFQENPIIWLAILVSLFVIIRHKSNIVRLLKGEEKPLIKKRTA